MLRDGFYDYDAFNSIENAFKTQMPYLKKAKKQHLSIRIFEPIGAKLFCFLYKRKFRKQLKEDRK